MPYKDPAKAKEAVQRSKAKHKVKLQQRANARRKENKLRALSLFGWKCCRCGYSKNAAALEFHHTSDDKTFSPANVMQKGWARVEAEIRKCILLCANCHREEHFPGDYLIHERTIT